MLKDKTILHIILAAFVVFAVPLTSCVYETYDEEVAESGPAQMRLTVAMPLAVYGEGSEYGTGWENYIDFAGDDWRLYLFIDDSNTDCEVTGEVTAGDFLSVTANADSTEYTIVANFPDGFLESVASNDRIGYCLLANWGYYETVTLGKTLLLSLVDELYANFSFVTDWGLQAGGEESFSDDYAKFDAMVDENGTALMPSKDVRIPFYGAQTTERLNLKQGEIWDVNYEITSLRAVAKVEVIMESTNVEIEELKLVGYNKQGYSGLPIYKKRANNSYVWWGNYDLEKPYLPNRSFTYDYLGIYLNEINYRSNDTFSTENVMNFAKVQDGVVDNGVIQYETWRAYVPEYDNTLNASLPREPAQTAQGVTNYNGKEYWYNNYDDYCYISMKIRGLDEEFIIYFADYDDDGTTDAYDEGGDTSKRLDILRNNIYRFYVQQSNGILNVWVNKWENEYDNTYEFGN